MSPMLALLFLSWALAGALVVTIVVVCAREIRRSLRLGRHLALGCDRRDGHNCRSAR